MARAVREREKRQRVQNAPTANLEHLAGRKAERVDFGPGELDAAERPIRPSDWTPGREAMAAVAFRVESEGGSERRSHRSAAALQVTLARRRRPPKSAFPHAERSARSDELETGIVFEAVPAGDYLAIFQPRGYRPFVRAVSFDGRDVELPVSVRLEPVPTAQDEDVLVRFGERSPFVESSRRFLARFGYLAEPDDLPRTLLDRPVSEALRDFQRFYRLRPTGTLTVETLLLMLRPRCAVPDVLRDGPLAASAGPPGISESDPISFMGKRWDAFALHYRLLDGTSDVTNEWTLIKAAMNRWAQVTPLTFATAGSGLTDLEFDFRRPSESGYPFDEGGDDDGNVLAHAWGPTNGLVEFDDYEDWGSQNLAGTATHEIGHALGLAHSSVEDATMYAYIHGGSATLHEVDVRGIKSLYPPVFRHSGPFVAYPLFAFKDQVGTDTVTIDLGSTRYFLAWGTITVVDSLVHLDRDNMGFIDVYEVDGVRTAWRVSGGDHFGSDTSPGNAHDGAVVRYGRRVTFRIAAGHSDDLSIAGYGIVLVLN